MWFYDTSRYILGASWAPVPTWAFAIVVVGAFTLFFAFLPGFITTVKTKDTSGMSLLMWLVTLAGLTFLVIFYALGIANTTIGATDMETGKLTHEPAPHFVIVFVCEAASLILSAYVFIFKLINMKKAKNMGITEAEYCARLAESKK